MQSHIPRARALGQDAGYLISTNKLLPLRK